MRRQSISSSRVTSDSGTAFGCCEPARNTRSDVRSLGRRVARGLDLRRARGWATGATRPSACAMPFGSTIMITAPSPRMVLPENTPMCRSFDDIGLTTISSVWNTLSTTMPKIWLPTCVTTMKPFVRLGVVVEPQQLPQVTSGKQLVAQAQHRRVLDALDAMLGVGARRAPARAR